jgi:hypothetical protein
MRRVEYLDAAEDELGRGKTYYEDQIVGLGQQILDAPHYPVNQIRCFSESARLCGVGFVVGSFRVPACAPVQD